MTTDTQEADPDHLTKSRNEGSHDVTAKLIIWSSEYGHAPVEIDYGTQKFTAHRDAQLIALHGAPTVRVTVEEQHRRTYETRDGALI